MTEIYAIYQARHRVLPIVVIVSNTSMHRDIWPVGLASGLLSVKPRVFPLKLLDFLERDGRPLDLVYGVEAMVLIVPIVDYL